MHEFPIRSEQLELLLAFAETEGLSDLGRRLRRDPSVISRALQKLAEDHPVVRKNGRRWELTDLGRRVNEATRRYLHEIRELSFGSSELRPQQIRRFSDFALIVINAQKAMRLQHDNTVSQLAAEINISRLLARWRRGGRPVIHAPHASQNQSSPFHRLGPGFAPLSGLEPLPSEKIFEKKSASAFAEAGLVRHLESEGLSKVLLVGFTANVCIDASARQAADLGFETAVVADACAMFDFQASDGRMFEATRIHDLTMANLAAFFSHVTSTDDVLNDASLQKSQ